MTDVSNTHVPVQEPLLKRADYDAALKSYAESSAWLLLFGTTLWLVSIWGGFELAKRLWPQQVFGLKDDCYLGCIAVVTIFAISIIPLAFFLYVGINRLRRRQHLQCPHCNGELASEDSQNVVYYSSYCPWCNTKLLIDSDRKRVTELYETLRVEMKGHLKFATIAWGVATPIMLAIGYFLPARPEGRTMTTWLLSLLLIPVLMVGMMWFSARSDLKRAKWRIELNEKA